MDDATKKRSFDPHISLLSRTGGLDAHFLNGKLLHRFAERCAGYDRDNRFFHEDSEDLRQAGYLTMPVPTELGGAGLTLAEVAAQEPERGWCAILIGLPINRR